MSSDGGQSFDDFQSEMGESVYQPVYASVSSVGHGGGGGGGRHSAHETTNAVAADIREFEIDNIRQYCADGKESYTFLVIGGPGSGKSMFVKNMLYYNRDKFTVGRVWAGTPEMYEDMKRIIGPLFVSNEWNVDEFRSYIKRQNTCISENGKKSVENQAVMIMDDILPQSKQNMYKSAEISTMVKAGSRHWASMSIVALQYAIDMGASVQTNFSFYVLFNEPSPKIREKLYKIVGCGTFDEFNSLMDALTGDFTAMVVNNRIQSSKLSDRVMYYRTVDLSKIKWKFGCDEFQEWNQERYNKNFSETFGEFA